MGRMSADFEQGRGVAAPRREVAISLVKVVDLLTFPKNGVAKVSFQDVLDMTPGHRRRGGSHHWRREETPRVTLSPRRVLDLLTFTEGTLPKVSVQDVLDMVSEPSKRPCALHSWGQDEVPRLV